MGFAKDLRQSGVMDMAMKFGQQRRLDQQNAALGETLAGIFGGISYPESPMSDNLALNSAVDGSIAGINAQPNMAAIAELMKTNPAMGLKAMEMAQGMQEWQQKQSETIQAEKAKTLADQTRELQNIIHAGLGLEDQGDQDRYFLKSIDRLEKEGKPIGRLQDIMSEPDYDVRRAQMNEMLNGLMKAEDMTRQFIRPTQDEAADNLREDRKVDVQEGELAVKQGQLEDDKANTLLRQQELGFNWAKLNQDAGKNEEDLKKQNFSDENTLRDEYTKATNGYAEISDAYGRIQSALSDTSGASDMALIFNYMKMLDPGSTVREGEFATAENTGGVSDKIRNLYNKALSGEFLSPSQRKSFQSQARAQFDKADKFYQKRRGVFEGLAKRNKLNPDNVVYDRRVVDDSDDPIGSENMDETLTGNASGGIQVGRFTVIQQ